MTYKPIRCRGRKYQVSVLMWKYPLFRPVVAIASLSYLMAVVMCNLMFDLMGNSEYARAYYCGLQTAALSNPLRLLPIASVICVTAVSLYSEVKSSAGSPIFLPELSIVSAMAVVQLPLFAKCLQLQFRGCDAELNPASPWPVHKNLLMSHTCVMLILAGTVFARIALLVHKASRGSSNLFSSSVSEVSSAPSGSSRQRKPKRIH
jgi:hypothetical protein